MLEFKKKKIYNFFNIIIIKNIPIFIIVIKFLNKKKKKKKYLYYEITYDSLFNLFITIYYLNF